LFQIVMCSGMNARSRTTPDNRVAGVDPLATTVVEYPIASVAHAPIARRAPIMGSVNVIASATLAYAGHAERMMTPAAATMITHTASPAITPRVPLAMGAV
jgi:hypothetical protein